jgi:putative tryptophan/tyrosine transport system substrate-binding protein
MNHRRKIIVALGASAIPAPFCSFAQQQVKVWRIGILRENETSFPDAAYEAFRMGMRDLGYAENRDYVLERRSAANKRALLDSVAAELLALKVDLILPTGTPSAEAARKVTREIPIVIASVGDPVGSGLVESLERPGGNVTGLTTMTAELYGKRLYLLHQVSPGMRRVGFLYNPDNAIDIIALREFESACKKLQITSILAEVREEIATAFKTLLRDNAQGFVVSQSSTTAALRDSIIEFAAQNRLPVAYPLSSFVESGGLISYGVNNADQWRRIAVYADKIFKGAKPGVLPIEKPIKFELVLNIKTAKALGIEIPDSIRVQATKLIE